MFLIEVSGLTESLKCLCFLKGVLICIDKKYIMKKALMTVIVLALLSSCTVHKLIGSYDKVITQNVDSEFDKVWGKVIDVFAQKGIPINVIDKSSGLIVSNKFPIPLSMVTKEKGGVPSDKNAFLVIPSTISRVLLHSYLVDEASGSFNVRVKKNESGKVVININLVNVESKFVPNDRRRSPIDILAKSTGVFEKKMIDLILSY